MECGNPGCGCNQNSFEIFTGQDKTVTLRAAYQQTGLPLDLSECTEITVALPNADGTFTQLTLEADQLTIVSPPVAGQIQVPITAAVSALLNVGLKQNIDVSYVISGLTTIVRFIGALSVIQSPL